MSIFQKTNARVTAVKASVLFSLFALASGAHAALPAWATSMITDASDNVTAVLTAIGPVIAVSVGGFLVIKLIKRGASKI